MHPIVQGDFDTRQIALMEKRGRLTLRLSISVVPGAFWRSLGRREIKVIATAAWALVAVLKLVVLYGSFVVFGCPGMRLQVRGGNSSLRLRWHVVGGDARTSAPGRKVPVSLVPNDEIQEFSDVRPDHPGASTNHRISRPSSSRHPVC